MGEKRKERDWDFDFSQYEHDEEAEEVIESIIDHKRPQISGLKSRFSNGEAELDRLAELNRIISKYSIQVAGRTQDMPILWKYYGVLDEFWESIRNIYGEHINKEINEIKQNCRNLLNNAQGKSGKINSKVHNNLLYFRSNLYRLKQLGNLGFEVERVGRGAFAKSKRQIIQ